MNRPAGTWLVEPLPKRGYARRPHFYVEGKRVSICGIAFKEFRTGEAKKMLTFDPETALTVEDDPRLGVPQLRRECGSCNIALEEFDA